MNFYICPMVASAGETSYYNAAVFVAEHEAEALQLVEDACHKNWPKSDGWHSHFWSVKVVSNENVETWFKLLFQTEVTVAENVQIDEDLVDMDVWGTLFEGGKE